MIDVSQPTSRASPDPAPASTSVLAGLPGLPGWSRRTDVEQVELYTRGSLYVVGWFLLGCAALAASARLGEVRPILVVVLAALVLGTASTMLLSTSIDRFLADSAVVPWRSLGLTVAVALALTAWATTLPEPLTFVVALMGSGTLGWCAGCLPGTTLRWGLLGLATALTLVATRDVFLGLYGGTAAGFFLLTTSSSLWMLRIVTELDRARGTQAALAVAEERLRFSRDVHDVLGRHLSTIAVQAELAATLAGRGDQRTGERILQVRATAHDALREARQLARGYRPLDLDQELDGAVSLLRSAGIRAHADLDGLPEAWHEPVARLVREAVTNVLRHSEASTVTIAYADQVVEVRDDGERQPVASDGSGLETLGADLALLGARLEAGPAETGFRVRLRLSGAEPVTGAGAAS